MEKSTEEMMNEILQNSEQELSFEEIIEKNKGNINEEEIDSEIAKIGHESDFVIDAEIEEDIEYGRKN